MCPNGVEWKTLGEVAKLERGVVISKEYLRDNAGDYPVYSSQTENNGEFGKINTYRYNGAYVTWTTDGAYAGTVFRRYGKFNITNVCGLINILDKDSIDVNYLYYILSITTKKYVNEGMGNPKLMSNVMAKVKIPLPPLAIQTRIVEILDHFTNLTANLTAELNLRRKQFEHYREKLLSLDGVEGVEWKTLGEVFETRNGYTPSTNNQEFWDDGTIPWFKMEDIRENGRILSDSINHITAKAIKGKGLFKANSVILATSATIGEHALITVEHLSNQRFTNFYPQKEYIQKLDMKFVYYYFYIIDSWCKEHTVQGNFAGVNMTKLYNCTIPVPPLATQHSIVSILDKFTALIENIEKELALRQKQYEYYREELLRFERTTF